jgi:Glycosyltransferase 61
MDVKPVYPAPAKIEIGNKTDNDPPVFEPVYLYKLPNSYITPYGYIISNFKVIKEGISFRHRNSISVKNIVSFLFFKKKVHVTQPALSITHGWHDSYYHFTLECLPKLYLLREFTSHSVLIFPKKIQVFHKEWFELLGVKNIQYLGENEIVKTPLAITSSFPARDLNHHNIILPEFATWVLSKIQNLSSIGFKKIFIGRKNPLHRKLLNNDDVKSFLNSLGFTYIEMEDFSIVDQIKIFHNAQQIICVHGAALSNLCFSKKGTKVIDLIHKDFKQWCFLKLSVIQQLDYEILECEGEGEHPLPGYKNIIVDTLMLKNKMIGWS